MDAAVGHVGLRGARRRRCAPGTSASLPASASFRQPAGPPSASLAKNGWPAVARVARVHLALVGVPRRQRRRRHRSAARPPRASGRTDSTHRGDRRGNDGQRRRLARAARGSRPRARRSNTSRSLPTKFRSEQAPTASRLASNRVETEPAREQPHERRRCRPATRRRSRRGSVARGPAAPCDDGAGRSRQVQRSCQARLCSSVSSTADSVAGR